jgi:hypothetical protein
MVVMGTADGEVTEGKSKTLKIKCTTLNFKGLLVDIACCYNLARVQLIIGYFLTYVRKGC